MSPRSKKSKNSSKQNEEDNFLIHEQNNNHIDSDSEAKNREMSINSELFYSMNNRSVEPLDRTPSIGASVGRGFSIVNANSNPPSNTANLSKRRQSFNKTKAMKAGSGHGNADLNSQNTVIRRPSENLEPFQFKHPFGGQPNTIIKNSGNTVKNGKKDVLMPPRSNSITSLLGAAAMMNSDSKRNSLINFNMNDLDKLNNNSGSNNVGTMKPPKKLPVTQKQQNNSNEMMEIHKAPSMSEFDFFGGNGRKDSFKAPSFIPQSLNDLDSDIFLNRKNSNVRGSMVLDNNAGRYSRTFSSGMQQFLNQNFGNQNGLSSDANNNNNSNIPKRNEGIQNQRHRTSSVGASQFADFIKGNENAISDDEDDDHHLLHRSGHHQTSDVRGQRFGNSDYEGKDDGMTTDDMIQLAHAAALAGGVPLSQQQHKQSFRNSFIGNGVNLQSLLQQDPTLSGNFNGRGRRSMRANSNTPMPMGTPPLHAFGNSFSMMNNMGLNVAITSDEEDHNHSHHSNDFDLFNQTGGLRDSFISGLSGQAAFSNSSSSTKSTKGKKKTTKKTATAMKKKNAKAASDPAVSEAKKQNKVVADAAFEAAAHASSLATINKQEKESFATQRRGKKLEKSKKMKMNNIMNPSMVTATPTTRTSKRKATQTSVAAEPNIINENKRFMGQGVISEFNTNNKKSENAKSMKSFGKIMKPSDFLTTTLNTSMEPTSKNSGNKKTAGVKRKLPAAESSKKKAVAKGKGSDEDVLNKDRTQDEVEAAAALQIIAKSESPIPPSGRKESSSEFEHTKFNRKDSMVQGVDTHLIHNDEVDQMDIDMKNQLMNASYEGYGDDEYEYNNNYQDDASESEDEEEDDEAMDFNEVEASEDEMDFENDSEESSKLVPDKSTSEKAKPKRRSRTATKKAASTEAKKVTRTRAPPVVRKPPVLLAEPIRVANPIIPQIKSENDDSNRNSLGEGEGSSAESSIKPEGSQTKTNNNDNVAVLGATNVDQLMLILQARQKGFQKHIKKTSDGKLDIFSNPDIIPPAVELVGGVDKPKVNDDGQHFSHGKDDDHDHRSSSAEGSINPNNRKMYVCKYCKKQFSQTTHLEVHVRSHVGLKPYTCEHCGKSFTQGGNLRTHIRLHTGEQPFKCDICSKRFSRKGNLQAHMLTHDKSKPFPCKLDDCEKSFTQLGNLKSHQNKFHSTTLNNLTLKLAEGLTGNESQEELEALDYLGSLYKNSNRGIKGRGKKQVPAAET